MKRTQLSATQMRVHPALDVARELTRAWSKRDWPAVIRLIHPPAVESAKQHAVEWERRNAVWQRQRVASPKRVTMLQIIYRVSTIEELEQLPATEVLTRLLQARYYDKEIPSSDAVLGVVDEGGDRAHAILRKPQWRSDRPDWDCVDVLTLVQTNSGWRALLNCDLVFDARGGTGIGVSKEQLEEAERELGTQKG